MNSDEITMSSDEITSVVTLPVRLLEFYCLCYQKR